MFSRIDLSEMVGHGICTTIFSDHARMVNQLTTETVADISQYISINVGGSGAEYEPLSRSL